MGGAGLRREPMATTTAQRASGWRTRWSGRISSRPCVAWSATAVPRDRRDDHGRASAVPERELASSRACAAHWELSTKSRPTGGDPEARRGNAAAGHPNGARPFPPTSVAAGPFAHLRGEFSPHSYGFRPKRSAHQAVRAARAHIQDGYGWVVALDIARFFDRVNHDALMGRVAKRVSDKRILLLLRRTWGPGCWSKG